MAKRRVSEKRPILVAAGNHLIDPSDVACISKIKDRNLYVVRLKSQPNMDFPIWLNKNNIGSLVKQFNIIVSDDDDDVETGEDTQDEEFRWDRNS